MRSIVLLSLFLAVGCSGRTTLPQDGSNTWLEERWGGVVPQELDYSCGAAALLTIMRHHFGDDRWNERELLRTYIQNASEEELGKAVRDGLSLLELEELAQKLDYQTARKMLTLEELERVVTFVPVLVYLEIKNFRHFAVVRGINENEVWLADSVRGNVVYSKETFLAEWRTPEELRKQWERPGGLMLFRKTDVMALRLLEEPKAAVTPSLKMLQRNMILRR